MTQTIFTGVIESGEYLARLSEGERRRARNRLVNMFDACAICGIRSVRLVIDHDHASGLVRGMLCTSCNTALGRFRDDATLLDRAADYLRCNLTHIERLPYDAVKRPLGE